MARRKTDSDLPTRRRILNAAKRQFQQRGYYAVGTAQILEDANAPKGSMYHHFPRGKEQIAVEVVDAIRSDLRAMTEQLSGEGKPAAQVVRGLALAMARWLRSSQWQQGTTLASMAIAPASELPDLHRSLVEALAEWRARLIALLTAEGWPAKSARIMADTVISAFEGAAIVARIDQSERALLEVSNVVAAMLSRRSNVEHAVRSSVKKPRS